VNVLKEEKRLMMLQVKAGEAEKIKLVGLMEEKNSKIAVQGNGMFTIFNERNIKNVKLRFCSTYDLLFAQK